LINTEVAQYGDSRIECAASDLVLHDALEVNNKVPAASASSKLFTAMSTPASIQNIIHFHMVVKDSTST